MSDAVLTMVSQTQRSFRCQELVEQDFEVLNFREHQFEELQRPSTVNGFGLARTLEEGCADPRELDGRRLEHFYWPNTFSPNEQSLALLEGIVTPEKVEEVEKAVALILRARGVGAKWLMWRVAPEWDSCREFDTMTTTHVLRARGTFIW